MRTTVEINDELFRKAKKKAADEGVPFRAVIESALRSYLEKKKEKSGYKLKWRPEKGRLQPGVDLEDRDSLFDIMDGLK
jgi:hypothetical protein